MNTPDKSKFEFTLPLRLVKHYSFSKYKLQLRQKKKSINNNISKEKKSICFIIGEAFCSYNYFLIP